MGRGKNRSWSGWTQSGGKMQQSTGSDTFTCAVDSVSSCSRAAKPKVYVDSRLWQSIVALCQRFNTEWLAYMVGEKDQQGDYEIKSLSFPEQLAGGAHVKREPDPSFRVPEGTIGAIHSHVNMQALFSTTDVAHANWPVEVVVNSRGEYEVSTRITLPCGESMRVKSSVVLLTGGILGDMEDKLKEALEKGKAKEEASRQTTVVWPPNGDRGGFDGRAGEYGFYNGAYRAADQSDRPVLLGGKFITCPICGKLAIKCPHNLSEMEKHVAGEEANKQVAP